jgi:hypothetical protein
MTLKTKSLRKSSVSREKISKSSEIEPGAAVFSLLSPNFITRLWRGLFLIQRNFCSKGNPDSAGADKNINNTHL